MEPDGNTVEEGLALHRAGRLPEAAAVYERVVAGDPANADALHYLGVIASQQGDQLRSVELLARAISLKPGAPKFHNNLGVALRELKRLPAAEAAFRSAIALDPDFGDALRNIALVLDLLGRPADCVPLWQRVLSITPDFADGWNRLGVALQETGLLGDAVQAFKEVVRLAPSSHIGLANLAGALNKTGRHTESLEAADLALKIAPETPEALSARANSLCLLGRRTEALESAERLVAIHPEAAAGHLALACIQKAEARFEDLIATYRRVLELEPDNAVVHFDKGMNHLLLGQFDEGWTEYEWRQRVPRLRQLISKVPCPRWNGEPLHGRTILIHAEQGVGDTLQFLRYLPRIQERGGKVVFVSQPGLRSFIRATWPDIDTFGPGEPLPPFHCEAPLMSLPLVFGTDLDSVPNPLPIERPIEGPVSIPKSARLKLGLVWAGDPAHSNDHNRSMALDLFEPVLGIGGIDFFSLQVGPRSADRSQLRSPERLEDLSARLDSYTATASLMRQLDLIISVDTSAAHLAGVLGRPVWTLLPFVPDWRWLLDREDSPWYPTMRLFRQRREGDWSEVIQRVGSELKTLRNGRSP